MVVKVSVPESVLADYNAGCGKSLSIRPVADGYLIVTFSEGFELTDKRPVTEEYLHQMVDFYLGTRGEKARYV